MFNIKNFELPETIKITEQVSYRIRFVESFKDPTQIGECDYSNKVISIRERLGIWATYWTLFHELEHAISHEKKLRITERQVNGLEMGFAEVARRNGWDH